MTTPSTNLTRLTEKYSNQHSRQCWVPRTFLNLRLLVISIDKYVDFIVSAISTAVYEAIPKSKSVRSKSDPISDETIALIKEKHRLRRQYSQNKDPAVKTRINQLQKQVKEEFRAES